MLVFIQKIFLTGLTVLSSLVSTTPLSSISINNQVKNYQPYKMGTVKQMNIKNLTYYFYNDMINIKNFDPILIKIDRKSYKDIGISNTGYTIFKKIDDYENIYSVNPFHLLVNHASEYIEEKGVNNYLIFDSTDENKELLKKYNDVWNGVKNKIEEVSSDKCDYEKDYMKIKLNLMMTYH